MNSEMHSTRLRPKLMSFDVFGTLISVRDSSYGAFERILADAGAHHLTSRRSGNIGNIEISRTIGTHIARIGRSANSRSPRRLRISRWRATAG